MLFSKRPMCPLCKKEGKSVLSKTLNALLKIEAKEKLNSIEGFSLCKTPTCKAVYFKANKVLTQDDVSVSVGFKDEAEVKKLLLLFWLDIRENFDRYKRAWKKYSPR